MTGAMVICAVIITSLVIRREFFSTPTEDVRSVVTASIAQWQSFASSGHRLGPKNAKVTIVEFIDFECPYCRDFVQQVAALRQEHPDSLAIVFRHFPLLQHPSALAAVRASECAANQGAFWKYHDALFSKQDLIGIREWDEFAGDTGFPFDFELFNRCVSNRGPIASLSRDTLAARELGVTGTPTALVNGELVVGARAIRNVVLKFLNEE